MYIYTYYSIKILDKKVPTLKEIPRSAPDGDHGLAWR